MTKMPTKKCAKCLETHYINMFSVNNDMTDGHLNVCKPCINDSARRRLEAKKNWRAKYLNNWERA